MIVSRLEDSSQENMELANKGVAKAFENYPQSTPARDPISGILSAVSPPLL